MFFKWLCEGFEAACCLWFRSAGSFSWGLLSLLAGLCGVLLGFGPFDAHFMAPLGSGDLVTELPAVKAVWCLMEAINQNQTEPEKLTMDQPTRRKTV